MRPVDTPRENRMFSNAEALEIRRAVRQRGESQASVARRFNCSSRTVYECVTRMTYDNVFEDFYWQAHECDWRYGPRWLKERMDANAEKARNDRVNGKNRRKPREGV